MKNSDNPLCKALHSSVLWAKEHVIKWSIRYNVKNNVKNILLSDGFIKPLIDYTGTKKTDKIIAIGNPVTIPVDLTGVSHEKQEDADSLC